MKCHKFFLVNFTSITYLYLGKLNLFIKEVIVFLQVGKSIFFFSWDKYSLNEFGNIIQFDELKMAVFKVWIFMDLKVKLGYFGQFEF